jgi:hypothetical protein
MTGTTLPESEEEFLAQLKIYFPNHWDMKFIMGKKNIHGGLQKVCAARLRTYSQLSHLQDHLSLLWPLLPVTIAENAGFATIEAS